MFKWKNIKRLGCAFFFAYSLHLFVSCVFLDLEKREKTFQYKDMKISTKTEKNRYHLNTAVMSIDKDLLEQFQEATRKRNNSSIQGHHWTFFKDVNIADFIDIIGKEDYSYVNSCPSNTYLAVFVHMPLRTYREYRVIKAIRHHWKEKLQNPERLIRLYFIIGSIRENEIPTTETLSSAQRQEIIRSPPHDIIQVNVVDHYLNLTMKTIAMVKWASVHCKAAKYIMKHDDDTYINTGRLLSNMRKIDMAQLGNIFTGRASSSHDVPKNGTGFETFHTDYDSYPLEKYPNFTSGFFYMYSNSITPKLLRRILMPDTPIISTEDIYLTGVVRVKEKINVIPMPSTHYVCDNALLRRPTLVAAHHYDYLSGKCMDARNHLKENNVKEND